MFTAVYALWSEHAGGHWQIIGGSFMDRDTVYNTQSLLERDWGIHNLAEGLAQVNLLIDKGIHRTPTTHWDGVCAHALRLDSNGTRFSIGSAASSLRPYFQSHK